MAAYQNPRAVQQKFEQLHSDLASAPERIATLEIKLEALDDLKAKMASIEGKIETFLASFEPDPAPSRSGRSR